MRRGLVAALACVFGALGCTGASNTNPPLPPTGNGGVGPGIGGSTVRRRPRAATSSSRSRSRLDGLIAPAGSLVDVRVARLRRPGDRKRLHRHRPASEAVVTKQDDTAELESTTLAPQGMDIFTGRISLGDRPTRRLHADGVGDELGRRQEAAAPVDFQIDGGPILLVTIAAAAARLQGTARHRGRRRLRVCSLRSTARTRRSPTIRRPARRRSAIRRQSSADLYRGMIDLRDPMPPMILPPLVDAQLLTVWATNVNGQAHRAAPGVLHRRGRAA